MKTNIPGDPKFVPPLSDQNGMCISKTKQCIFKYNLFRYYLELFRIFGQLYDPFFGNIRKSTFLPNFLQKNTRIMDKNGQKNRKLDFRRKYDFNEEKWPHSIVIIEYRSHLQILNSSISVKLFWVFLVQGGV